jgi:NAD(P)-dependent dehydrogenase (short-subunit alcohol dehydrogenase family)
VAAIPGWRIVHAVRSPGRLPPGAEHVQVELASLESVRAAADKIADRYGPVHALVLNAGLQHRTGDLASEDGHELTFAVNHLAQFLLATLLRPVLTDGARIVTLSSGTHRGPLRSGGFPAPRWAPLADLLRRGRTNGLVAYSTSKLAAVYLAYEAAARWPDLRVNAYDPGLVASTGLGRHLPGPAYAALRRSEPVLARVAPFAHTVEESGTALAELATGADFTGRYVEVRRVEASSDESYDPHRARRLWDDASAFLSLT